MLYFVVFLMIVVFTFAYFQNRYTKHLLLTKLPKLISKILSEPTHKIDLKEMNEFKNNSQYIKWCVTEKFIHEMNSLFKIFSLSDAKTVNFSRKEITKWNNNFVKMRKENQIFKKKPPFFNKFSYRGLTLIDFLRACCLFICLLLCICLTFGFQKSISNSIFLGLVFLLAIEFYNALREEKPSYPKLILLFWALFVAIHNKDLLQLELLVSATSLFLALSMIILENFHLSFTKNDDHDTYF